MKIASGWSTDSNPQRAAEEAFERMHARLGTSPHLIFLHSSCAYDNEAVLHRLCSLAPGTPLQGGTSCLGVLTEQGFHSENGLGLGILGLFDPEGSYGAGIARQGDDPAAAVTKALVNALEQAARPGEIPSAVVMSSCPGSEEQMIRAIEEYLGTDVPILGGSSADNDMSGQWQQFANDALCGDGVSIAVLFPSGDVSYAFHSGYEPVDFRGKATRVSGRILREIDGRPAAEVYNNWTNGLIADVLQDGGSLVPIASLTPVGQPVGQVGGITYYKLSYPVASLPDKGLQLFAEIQEGSEVVLMKGTPESIISRAGRAVKAAMDNASFSGTETEGMLMLFCTGCMLAVKDDIGRAVRDIQTIFPGKAFLCSFTLGEQGCFIRGENRHGNLMIATLLIGPTGAY